MDHPGPLGRVSPSQVSSTSGEKKSPELCGKQWREEKEAKTLQQKHHCPQARAVSHQDDKSGGKGWRSNHKKETESNSKLAVVEMKKAAKHGARLSKGMDFVTGNTVGMLIRRRLPRQSLRTHICSAKRCTHGKRVAGALKHWILHMAPPRFNSSFTRTPLISSLVTPSPLLPSQD